MLTSRLEFRCGHIDQNLGSSSTFIAPRRIPHIPHHSNGVGINRRNFKRVAIQASHEPRINGRNRASLSYVRSLSTKGLEAPQPSTNADSVNRFVTDTVAERMLVIPYADLVLRRKLDGGYLLTEANGSSSSLSAYCWEEAWKLYIQSQTAALKEASARAEACIPQITTDESAASTDGPVPAPCSTGNICEGPPQEKQSSLLSKLRVKKLRERRTNGLILLNVLAALYGSSTVAGKFATEMAPGLPPSLSTLVRFSSAVLIFLPVMINIVSRGKHYPLFKAGAELGGLLFAAAILETCGNESQVGDVWGLAASAIYALHIFRSEAHSKNFKPFELTAIQCGTVASLSLVWEAFRIFHDNTTAVQYMSQLQSLPWGPLVYTGLVSSGLCSWLEIHGLRSVHASTATMVNTTIPIWGAFLSFFLRGDTLDDSVIVGGLVILVASFFAQLVSKHDDTDTPRPQKPPNPKTLNHQSQAPLPSTKPSSVPDQPAADHVQGAILTSQLKFPYYAAQAKRLLMEAKIKLLSMKSLIMSTLLNVDSPHGLHAEAPTAIATSISVQTLSSGSSPLPNSGAHAAMAAQWLDVAAGFLESAITALSSDMVQAVGEVEDIARVAEQASQDAMAHLAMAAAGAKSLLDTATRVSVEFSQSVDISALADRSLACAHHADVAVLQILLACAPPSP